jgi:hypothetical protein
VYYNVCRFYIAMKEAHGMYMMQSLSEIIKDGQSLLFSKLSYISRPLPWVLMNSLKLPCSQNSIII